MIHSPPLKSEKHGRDAIANEQQATLTLAEFSRAKLIPIEFLKKAQVAETRGGLTFHYGNAARQRIRRSVGKDGWGWSTDNSKPIAPYTADVLPADDRPNNPQVYLVEGESDSLTMWHAGRPCVGIPGASMSKTLELRHLTGFEGANIWQEPGNGGEEFVKGLMKRLRDIGYKKAVYVVSSKTDKDPSALWIRCGGDIAQFDAELIRLKHELRKLTDDDNDDLTPISFHDLMKQYPVMREPVIFDLLRRGETMNVIADPKAGKSWLSLDMAISIATGQPWLSKFPVNRGRCLIVDNELHKETLSNRPSRIAEARDIRLDEFSRQVDFVSLRGKLRPLDGLEDIFSKFERGRYDVIILDAWYRFTTEGSQENSNSDQAKMYNLVDRYAEQTGAAFVLIHHATKGNQSEKKVTDVGAGGGAQSRAADTHLVIRPHEEKGLFVVDAAVRSFAPITPFCVRWGWPVFKLEEGVDPELLKNPIGRPRRDRTNQQSDDAKYVADICRTIQETRESQGRDDIYPIAGDLKPPFQRRKSRFSPALKNAVALGLLEIVPVKRKVGNRAMRDCDGYRVPIDS